MRERSRVAPGKPVSLADFDLGDTLGGHKGSGADSMMKDDRASVFGPQAPLNASRENSVLIVLPGIETGGTDGTIRHVFSGANSKGAAWLLSRFRAKKSSFTITAREFTARLPRRARSSSPPVAGRVGPQASGPVAGQGGRVGGAQRRSGARLPTGIASEDSRLREG
jgi:hypothetical protein